MHPMGAEAAVKAATCHQLLRDRGLYKDHLNKFTQDHWIWFKAIYLLYYYH